MKNKILIAIFFSAFLLIAFNVQAANFTDNETVDTNKTWTIKFTNDIGFDDLTKQSITVIDSKGTTVNVGVQSGQDTKTVIVTAPEGGYTPGESYILNVGSKVHSSKGKALKNEYKVHFNIKKDSIGSNVVTFKDKNFEQLVRDKIRQPAGDILKSEVEKITDLSVYGENISDISGIENFINLQNFHLSDTQVSDISILKNLTNLQGPYLGSSKISDISILKVLTNLQDVSLVDNQVSDISALSGLTNLEYLSLSGNQISNIDILKKLTNLKNIKLYTIQISDISKLKELPSLETLYLFNVQINDISALTSALKELTHLNCLNLYDSQISDTDLQSLKQTFPMWLIDYCPNSLIKYK